MTNLIGQSLGRYLILEQIGEGGMAVVYKALDTRLGRDVALKVIRTEKLTLETMGKTLKRFEREAKALAKLTHPNIVPVMDFGEYEGRPFLVMPYISGGTLKERLGRPIPWREAARLLVPIARALQYDHQQRIVHRDVKPSNILIAPSGDSLLTDFGIAKILADTEETSDLTGTGMGIGTPEYMSPEQFQGEGVDARTDVYSLGVIFYEMVTGRKPYTATTPAAILVKQATEALPRPSAFVRGLPGSVENALVKALAKKPENRYADMGEFLRTLEAFAKGNLTSASDLTGTATLDDSYDAYQTYEVKEPTYSTVDQNAHQRTTTTQTQPPAPPRPTLGWLPWAAGGLVLCVMGVIAVAIIAMVPSKGGTPSSQEPIVSSIQPTSSYVEPTTYVQPTLYVEPTVYIQPTAYLEPTVYVEPTIVPSPTTSLTCPGAEDHPTRLKPDSNARVCTNSERVIVRTNASMKAPEVLSLYPDPNTSFPIRILEGPVCADNFWWWKIEIYPGTLISDQNHAYSDFWRAVEKYTGWAREGWDKKDDQFLCSIPQ